MRTIAIVFGDNDFAFTFMPLLDTVYRAITWGGELTPELIERTIRSGIECHYLAFQQSDRFPYGDIEKTVEYLNGIRVLFDEDAEFDISQNDHNGGAWYLEVISGRVWSY